MTEYANKLFTLPKTTLATGSRIAMNQYGKYVRKYQWQGDENAMSQYLAALLKLDFGRYFRKSLFTSEGQDGIHTQMSLSAVWPLSSHQKADEPIRTSRKRG